MRNQSPNKGSTPTVDRRAVDHSTLSPRTQALYERFGHYGPFSSKEYESIVGTLAPTTEPQPAPPVAVVEAQMDLDRCLLEWQGADQVWRASVAASVAARAKGASGGRYDRNYGTIKPSASEASNIARAEAREVEAREEREEAGERLSRSRDRHHQLSKQWEREVQRQHFIAKGGVIPADES